MYVRVCGIHVFLCVCVPPDLKYLRYLESVQEETGDEYTEVSGLLDRFKTLTEAHKDLTTRQEATQKETEVEKGRVATLKQAQVSSMLNANNQIAALKKRLDQLRDESLALQQQAEDRVINVSSRTRELGQVRWRRLPPPLIPHCIDSSPSPSPSLSPCRSCKAWRTCGTAACPNTTAPS